MSLRFSLSALLAFLFTCTGVTSLSAQPSHINPQAVLTFERDIRPLLKTHCLDCHGAVDEKKGGLDLRLRRLMLQGGDSGPAITPGQPQDSFLLDRLRAGEMPPSDKKMPADKIAVVERWIALGAPTARQEPNQIGRGVGITPEERKWWAFQPIRPPKPLGRDLMTIKDGHRVRTPIDALVLSRLTAVGLSFSGDADKRTLIRRAYFDLTGLPPPLKEIQQFVADESPDAYERLIDRLLDSPHYGERWARHWLDIAGYADSEGYNNADPDRQWAYKYRDYVIQSFNDDKPFDRFLHEQLAGDEMTKGPYKNLTAEQIDKLVATGFLRMAADGTDGSNNDQARNQTVADTIKIVSTALLGLSVGCAQCHDHRYDPIPQRDYYQLRAVFEPALNWRNWRTPSQRRISLYTDKDRAEVAKVEAEAQKIAAEKAAVQKKRIEEALAKELERHPQSLRPQLRSAYETPSNKRTSQQQALLKKYPSVNITPGNLYQYNQKAADELKKYDQRMAEVRKKKPVEQFLRALTENLGDQVTTHVFHRGEFKQPTEAVLPAALTITAAPEKRRAISPNRLDLPTTGRRLAFAQWLTSNRHPLVARVIVNRIWMHHFGRGIVGTPADFGVLGERPSRPKLLDWLAHEFRASGWSLKRLHKLIMTSTVYRQSSNSQSDDARRHALNVDSANRLYWKWPVQRLDAEIVRDRILATCGQLRTQMYGPPVSINEDDAGQVTVGGDPTRRSIYIRVKRTKPVALLTAFDAPVMVTNCDRRTSSTAATQSLMLMNSDFILRHAQMFTQRVQRETTTQAGAEAQITRAWRLAYRRPPTSQETQQALDFLTAQIQHIQASGAQVKDADPKLQALTNLCQVLFSSNEFLYVD